MGALYLSSKLEETPLSLRDVINVFHRLISTDAHTEYTSMSLYGPTYYEWKDSVVVAEMQILKRLGFDVYVGLVVQTLKIFSITLNNRYSSPTHYSSTTLRY